MPQTPRNPSPTHPIVTFPTERVEDVLLITEHDTRLPSYEILAYGAAYAGPEADRFPGLTLVFQEPAEADQWIRRYWAADRDDQEAYNAAIQYSGGSSTHPVYIRTYILPQGTYAPVAEGTADPIHSGAKLVEEVAEPTEKMAGYLTVKRVYETLPGPALTGKEVSSQFGGGVLTTTKQDVAPGTSISGGLNVVDAAVVPVSAGKSALQKSELPEGEEWPEMTESKYVTELGVHFTIKKKVIANTAQTGSRTVDGSGNLIIVEYDPIDRWKTVRITTTIPASVFSGSKTFSDSINYSFPNEITTQPYIVKAEIPGVAEEDAARITDIAWNIDVIEGYSGPINATVTRTFHTSSPSPTTAQKWFPKAVQRNVVTLVPGSGGGNIKTRIVELRIPSSIHPGWTISVPTISLSFVGGSGGYVASYDTVDVVIPASTPTAIPHGSTITAAVKISEWNYGIFVKDVYTVVCP